MGRSTVPPGQRHTIHIHDKQTYKLTTYDNICSNCEAYVLKKHGLTRSDCTSHGHQPYMMRIKYGLFYLIMRGILYLYRLILFYFLALPMTIMAGIVILLQ